MWILIGNRIKPMSVSVAKASAPDKFDRSLPTQKEIAFSLRILRTHFTQ